LLRSAGYSAEAYASAEEFLDAHSVVAADCLILDICLPGMSGLDLQRHLSSTGRQLPIVFITAFEESAERCRVTAARLGARAFVNKPCGSNDLLEAVRYALVDDE
jgi:FixJ family two-component response regulator